MITLPNPETREIETVTPSDKLDAFTFPEAKSSLTGATATYHRSADKCWFVFRASYGRVDKAADILIEDGTYVYVAKRTVRKMVKDKVKKVLENLIPNLLFVYTTPAQAEEYIKRTSALVFLTYYYNHFATVGDQKNPPLTVSCREMENFIIATCNNSEHLKFVDESQCHYKSGDIVRVIDGMFKGVEGRVARVSGQQRVIVSISNVGLVSTAYVPTAFLRKIENSVSE